MCVETGIPFSVKIVLYVFFFSVLVSLLMSRRKRVKVRELEEAVVKELLVRPPPLRRRKRRPVQHGPIVRLRISKQKEINIVRKRITALRKILRKKIKERNQLRCRRVVRRDPEVLRDL